ncbi:MAG TPA: dephospho-CoA kinase [Polyangiaceae bacterium]
MRVFGLTGGIASGKSTVAARFRGRGAAVVDADALAREVVAPGSEGLAALVAAFGAHVLAEDGSLDRKKLAAEVFGDAQKLARLNGITHPRIAALSAKRMAELDARGEPLACYEAALLVENGLADAFRPLVVVSAPLEAQVARARARDAADEAAVRARIAAQLALDEKVRAADVVVKNDGTLADLRARADDAFDEVCRRVGVDPARYPL